MAFADRKKREKEERREDIVNTAEKLFLARGYDGVAMEEIAKELGINKALLYYYFKDKASLYFAVVLPGQKQLVASYKAIVESGRASFEKLIALATAYFEFSKKYPDFNRVFNYTISETARLESGEAAKEVTDLQLEAISLMRDAVKAGIDDGTIRNDLDPLEIVVFIISASGAMYNLNAGLRMALEAGGISYGQFVMHSSLLFGKAILAHPEAYAGSKPGAAGSPPGKAAGKSGQGPAKSGESRR